MRRPFIILSLILFVSTLAYSQDESASFRLTENAKTLLIQKLDRQWNQLFEPELKQGSSLIAVAGFALDAASIRDRSGRLETALRYLKQNINRSNPNSATFGNVFWYYGDTAVNDANAVEFCMRQIIPIWILYRDELSSDAKNTLQEIIDLCTEGVIRHRVKLSYTNIVLMKIANLIMLGEYCDRPELARMGYGLLKDWIRYTYQNGLCEYLSPTYYTVDIENLSLIFHFTRDPEIKNTAAVALEYIWTDIALNWYQPSQRLGGTHSRDYDRLYGHNSLDRLVTRAGWIDTQDKTPFAASVFDYYAFVKPGGDIRKFLERPLPRFVSQRWGEEAFQRASHYIGTHFSVGSAEGNYYNMDKTPWVVNLGGGSDTPVINFFMDGREDYYGFKKIREKSGHLKSLHLKPFLMSVQNDGEVLFLALAADNTDPAADKLESVITLPSDSEIWLDNRKLNVFNWRSSWEIYPQADEVATKVETLSGTGKTEIRLTDNDKTAGIGIRRKFPVAPGVDYQLGVHAKGDGISLYINFYDSNDNLIGKEHFKTLQMKRDAFTWNEMAEKAPNGAAYCNAWIYSSKGNTGQLTIDDFSFEETRNDGTYRTLGCFDFKEDIPQKFIIPENANLFIKREDAAAAIRLITALDVSGRPIPFTLFNDGLQFGALRLTATHSALKTGRRGTIAVWSFATEGISDERAFADFRHRVMAVKSDAVVTGDTVNVKVDGITGQLELAADIAHETRIVRRGMKPGCDTGLLSVNGTDVGRRILEKLDCIRKLCTARL